MSGDYDVRIDLTRIELPIEKEVHAMSEADSTEMRLARARLALEGLFVGDALGEIFFSPSPSLVALMDGN